MGVKVYKPVTPSLRNMTGYSFEEITKGKKPERSLLVSRHRQAGRNLYGKVTVRHRGGGTRPFLRIVDFKRDKRNIEAHVTAIEYDPTRTARLALLEGLRRMKAYGMEQVQISTGIANMAARNLYASISFTVTNQTLDYGQALK